MRIEAMAESAPQTSPSHDDPSDATLVFHEQADGRKAARLHGGKVVLVDYARMDRVKDGEAWFRATSPPRMTTLLTADRDFSPFPALVTRIPLV